MGSYDFPAGHAYKIWGDGTYLYSADNNGGLHAYTFDGTTFTLLDTYPTAAGFFNYDVGIDGTYIYNAAGVNGVDALTFDGTTFTHVANIDFGPHNVVGLEVEGNYIYAVSSHASGFNQGIHALTFDGTSFTEVDHITSNSYNAVDIFVDGNYIFMANYQFQIRAFTFDGSSFVEVATIGSPNFVGTVWGDGTYVYGGLAGSGIRAHSGFECLSYNSEMRLTKDGTLGINKPTPQAKIHSANRIRSDEGIMIGNDTNCSTGTDIGVMRYTGTPAEPFEVCDGTAWQGLSTYTAATSSVDTVNCSPISFELLDVADVALNTAIETNRILIGGLERPCDLSVASDSSSITINKNGVDETGTIVSVDNGDVVYLKIRSANAEITETNTYISLGDKTDQVTIETECTGTLTEEDTLTTTELNDVVSIIIDGDYAYVATIGYDGLVSVDISDPTNMSQTDSVTNGSDILNPGKMDIQGEIVYIAVYGSSRITSVDISDPTNLTILDSTSATNISNPGAVAIKGNYAFLANSDGIISIDISDPSNMTEADYLSSTDMDGGADIKIIGDHAFVVAYTDRTLTSIDISDPTNMSQTDSTTSPSSSLTAVNDMEVKGNYIFATSNLTDSVAVFDVSDPTNLTEIENYVIPSASDSGAIALLGNYVYVGDSNGGGGLAKVDISDPTNLSEKAYTTSTNINNPVAIAVKGEYVFVGATADDSITSFKIKCQ